MNRVNSIVLVKNEYETREDFANAIKEAVMVLLRNDYIMTVRNDDKGIGVVTIDFESDNQEFGAPYPYWLTIDEVETLACEAQSKNDSEEAFG